MDKRSSLTRCRNEWLASYGGRVCRQGEAEGKFLQNRLERAFNAGWYAAARQAREELQRVSEYLEGCE